VVKKEEILTTKEYWLDLLHEEVTCFMVKSLFQLKNLYGKL